MWTVGILVWSARMLASCGHRLGSACVGEGVEFGDGEVAGVGGGEGEVAGVAEGGPVDVPVCGDGEGVGALGCCLANLTG